MSRREFLASSEAEVIRVALRAMTIDPCFNTKSTYTASSDDGLAFIDKHMKYLGSHPKINPQQYLSNIKLMTRVKPS